MRGPGLFPGTFLSRACRLKTSRIVRLGPDRAARQRGIVDGPWMKIELGDIYSEMHNLQASINHALKDDSIDADELDSVIPQLRHCGVPQEALSRLLVAMGDGDTSDEDKQLLLKYCPDEVPTQKAAMCVARSRSGRPEIQLRCCSGRLPLQGECAAEVFRRWCVVARSAARTTAIGVKIGTSQSYHEMEFGTLRRGARRVVERGRASACG